MHESGLVECSSRSYRDCAGYSAMAVEEQGSLVDRFPALRRLGRNRRRIPFIQQLSESECGAACLAMVLEYHGKQVSLEEVRETCAVNRDGVNARTLLE